MWPQVYDPFGSMVLSTLVAAIPVVVLLGALGLFHMKAHYAAGLGLVGLAEVAIFGFGMPVRHGRHVGRSTAPLTACCRSAGSCSTSSSCTG